MECSPSHMKLKSSSVTVGLVLLVAVTISGIFYGKNRALEVQVHLLNVQLKALTDQIASLQFQLDKTTEADFLRRYLKSLPPVDSPRLQGRF